MPLPRVLILHNEPVLPTNHPNVESEQEVLETVEIVEKTLTSAGFTVGKLGVSHDPAVLIQGIQRFRPDAVFNLFEGTGDDGNNEAYAAGLLDWLKVPFTGCSAQTLSLAHNKAICKHLFRAAGLPTADFVVIEDGTIPQFNLDWPVIVKPGLQDASVGLDQGSVVCNRQQLQLRVMRLLELYGSPVVVEEFIRGREFNVAVVEMPELTVLPVSEIVFTENKPGYWPIVTYDAKWRHESEEYLATPAKSTVKLAPRLAKRLAEIAKAAFLLTGCRDYGRVDFRVRSPGRPYILEVNPNPDFSPEAGLADALKGTGMSHDQLTVQLVHNALSRAGRQSEFDFSKSAALQSVS